MSLKGTWEKRKDNVVETDKFAVGLRKLAAGRSHRWLAKIQNLQSKDYLRPTHNKSTAEPEKIDATQIKPPTTQITPSAGPNLTSSGGYLELIERW